MAKKVLKENNNKNTKRVYLDFASQTMQSKKVSSEMKKVRDFNFNPSNLYKEGLEADNILHEARVRVSRVLGVRDHEIYFTGSGTLSCTAAIFGILNKYKEENKKNRNYIIPHIITSNIEHDAVLENIKYLEKNEEIEVTYIEVDEFGLINVDKVKDEIKENTILISIMYVNNEVGTILDIKNISKKIKEYKKEKGREIMDYPHFHTDAAQAGNYLSLYIDMLGVDMLSLNGSKIYGPKSSGILFKKEYVKISPFYFGGGQERDIFSGTLDIEKCVGISFALEEAQKEYKNQKTIEKIAIKRNNLIKDILKNIPEAKIIGAWNENEWKLEKQGISRESREVKRIPSNISLYLKDFPSDEIVIRLDKKGFAVSAGSACSAKTDEYSHVIFNILKNKIKKIEAEKVARETIRITIDKNTKEKDLKDFAKSLKEIYFKFKK